MAEERIDLPLAPEVMNSSSVELRRNSMSKTTSGNIEDVLWPHYRRVSIGSCHDFCKYGGKLAFQVKEKHSVASRIQISSLSKISEADVNGVKTHVANRRASTGSKPPRKASMAKVRESVNSRPRISNTCKKEMPTKLADSTKQGGSEVPATKEKTSVVKLKTIHRKSNPADLPKIVKQGNSSISVKMVGTSSKPALVLVRDSSESIMDPVGTPSISTLEPVDCSSNSTPQPAETSSILTVEPGVTSSESIMDSVGIPSIPIVEPVECSSKSTPELVQTSLKLNVEPVETSSILALESMATSSESIMEPVGTSSKSIEEMVGTSSKSCEECVEAASKSTAESVEVLSKSIAKKEDVSSKSTVKKARASPKLPTKKVEALPGSTTPKGRASSKSTSQKIETSSKSSAKKLETASKSTAEKLETPKLAGMEEMSMKSTAKQVVMSTKSNAKVGISSKSVVKKVVTSPKSTVKNVEASSTSNFLVRTSSKPAPLKSKLMKASGNHVAPLKSNSITVSSTSSMNPSQGSNGQSNSKLKMEKEAASLKVAARKLTTPSRVSLLSKSSLNKVLCINARKHKSLKIASQLKNQLKTRKYEHREPGNDVVEEKTLYVIKMESGNRSFQTNRDVEFSPQSSLFPKFSSSSQERKEESECKFSEGKEDSFSANPEDELMKNGETVGIVSSEDKASQMSTLNLRRGGLGELQSETTPSRTLKFQSSPGFGENPMVKLESVRRSFKRRQKSDIDRVGTPTGPEKVVLRRQGSHDRQDGHGLFNNVIEETANKLEEIRKSKVKALVGAFETIISLQEREPDIKAIS